MKCKLICIPHAGGSSLFFKSWAKELEGSFEIIELELKGRGKRYKEEFYNDVEEAVNDIYNLIVNEIIDCNYIIAGYSMGSLLAYELLLKLQDNGIHMPIHAFFMARNAPDFAENSQIHKLPDNLFIDQIINLGGTNGEVLRNPELASYFVPILKADYKLHDSYCIRKDVVKINCDFSIINGVSDPEISSSILMDWSKFTNRECRFSFFEGDHFFVNKHLENVLDLFNYQLKVHENESYAFRELTV